VRFAKNDGAGCAQLLNDHRVCRHMVAVNREGSSCGLHLVISCDVVLDEKWNSMERATNMSSSSRLERARWEYEQCLRLELHIVGLKLRLRRWRSSESVRRGGWHRNGRFHHRPIDGRKHFWFEADARFDFAGRNCSD